MRGLDLVDDARCFFPFTDNSLLCCASLLVHTHTVISVKRGALQRGQFSSERRQFVDAVLLCSLNWVLCPTSEALNCFGEPILTLVPPCLTGHDWMDTKQRQHRLSLVAIVQWFKLMNCQWIQWKHPQSVWHCQHRPVSFSALCTVLSNGSSSH